MKKCSCGYESSQDFNFCPSCGKRQSDDFASIISENIINLSFSEHTALIFELYKKNIIFYIILAAVSYLTSFLKGISSFLEVFLILFFYISFGYYTLSIKMGNNEKGDFLKDFSFNKYNYSSYFAITLIKIGLKYGLMFVIGIISAIILMPSILSGNIIAAFIATPIILGIWFIIYSLIAVIMDFSAIDQVISQDITIWETIKKIWKNLFKNINPLTVYYLKMTIVFIPLLALVCTIIFFVFSPNLTFYKDFIGTIQDPQNLSVFFEKKWNIAG